MADARLEDAKPQSANPMDDMDMAAEEERRRKVAEQFADVSIRNAFMRKVFLIVAAQLIVTCLIITPLLLHEPTKQTLREDRGIFWAANILFLVVYFVVICCRGLTRSSPLNYFILAVLTVTTAVWVGCICAAYNFQMVLLAVAVCAGLCFCLAVVATQSQIDFTGMMGVMLVFALALLVLTILFIFIPSKGLMWIIMIGAVVLLSIYFIIDIQLMMGGNHKFALSPEDYILAATLLYVDVVYLFVYILMILSRSE